MFGNILIVLAFLASLYAMAQFYRSYKIGKVLKSARLSYHVMTILIISASVFLLYAIITHQYQYKYVFDFSNADLSNGMLLSTFFAGQEGSFLLWLLFTSLIGLFFLDRKDYSAKKEASFMGVYTLAVSFLLLMVTPLLKSPFEYIWSVENYLEVKYFNESILNLPALSSYIFSNSNNDGNFVLVSEKLLTFLKSNGIAFDEFLIRGKGLNPLLQNFWMQIHPPILFLGYAFVTIPYSFAVSATIRNEYTDWIGETKFWVIISSVILGLGIMIGGYWAYGVLGWGGYWAWDPVENASLIPWIVLTALLHTLIIQNKSWRIDKENRFVKTNLILAVLSYVFVIYSTFLTRSGILSDASVHSFSDPGEIVYVFLLIYIFTFIGLGFGSVYLRRNYIVVHQSEEEENIFSREYGLFYGAFAMVASAIVVLVGTSAPIFGQSVELDFYNKMNLPLVILMNLLIGITLFLKWKNTNSSSFLRELLPSTVITIVTTILFAYFSNTADVVILLFAFSALFTLIVNLQYLYHAIRKNLLHTGGHITHAGFALFILGVLTTGFFSESAKLELNKGESVTSFGKSFTFVGYNEIENSKKFAFNVEVTDGDKKSVIKPVMFMSEYNGSLMRNPDILIGFAEDIYISPLGFEDGASVDNSVISLKKKESKTIGEMEVTFDSFEFPEKIMDKMTEGADFEIGVNLRLSINEKEYSIVPQMIFKEGKKEYSSVKIDDENLLVSLISLDVGGNVSFSIKALDDLKAGALTESQNVKKESLSAEVSIKPFISFVWLGIIVMSIGMTISSIRRKKEMTEHHNNY